MTNVVKLPVNGHGFEEFWDVCPKKEGKLLARIKWEKITTEDGFEATIFDRSTGHYEHALLRATPAELIEGMRRYRKKQTDPETYKLKDDGRYTLQPTQWLNQGRWMDD